MAEIDPESANQGKPGVISGRRKQSVTVGVFRLLRDFLLA